MQNTLTLPGLFVAPLVVALILAGFGDFSGGFNVLGLLFVYVLAFFGMCIFALPLFLLLDRMNLVRWWSCLAAGLFVGGLIAWIARLPNSSGVEDVLPFAVTGAASALSFWAIWWLGSEAGQEALKSSYR